MQSNDLTAFMSTFSKVAECVRLRLRFKLFFVRMWLLKACLCLIFPVPVRANLFLAPELVLFFLILFVLLYNM